MSSNHRRRNRSRKGQATMIITITQMSKLDHFNPFDDRALHRRRRRICSPQFPTWAARASRPSWTQQRASESGSLKEIIREKNWHHQSVNCCGAHWVCIYEKKWNCMSCAEIDFFLFFWSALRRGERQRMGGIWYSLTLGVRDDRDDISRTGNLLSCTNERARETRSKLEIGKVKWLASSPPLVWREKQHTLCKRAAKGSLNDVQSLVIAYF